MTKPISLRPDASLRAQPISDDRLSADRRTPAGTSAPAPAPRSGEGWLTAHGIRKSFKSRMVVKGVSLDVN
ncbi:MAG: LPS export ABC transporter ATP-binding protein, partial [Hyphomicrobiaceae bacterium]|nr:LPS export ABC transporter ATP-binding protein [Hyphomicrobiaceae bacterium]